MALRRFTSLFILSYLLCSIGSSSLVSAQNVSLALYYESLCPYSANFIVNGLAKIFESGLVDIVDLKLVPYGNARIGSDGTSITCQHGPYECLLNTVEACALNAWPDLDTHFRFIYCIESLVMEGTYRHWPSCFKKSGLESKPITDCTGSGLGKKLELKYAAETNALQPPHKYVPWVVVDGQPLYEEYMNFISYVCAAYKGTAVVKACKELLLQTVTEVKSDRTPQVSFADQSSTSPFAATGAAKITSQASSGWHQVKMAASK
ncbi:hypothetical protein Sjap_014204 [Stephania japonica]|uniref:Gamma-interferon-inducible lysosomal thiol reductase n=1 Tax=Stephania japonica TaxID=461633 RepID=A0AAP0IZ74_9MAGN